MQLLWPSLHGLRLFPGGDGRWFWWDGTKSHWLGNWLVVRSIVDRITLVGLVEMLFLLKSKSDTVRKTDCRAEI